MNKAFTINSIFIVQFLILIIPGFICAQAPDTCWTFCWDGDSADLCYGVEATPDGGCVLVGSTRSSGNGKSDVLVLKVDSLGGLQWMRSYGSIDDDCGYDIVTTEDNGYLITGETRFHPNMGSDIYVIKTDSSGDTLWTRVVGGTNNDRGNAAIILSDNSAVIAGTTESFTADSSDMIVIKVNAGGNIDWIKSIDVRDYDRGIDIDAIETGGFYLFGNTRDTVESGICLSRLDNNGDTLWTRCYDHPLLTGTYYASGLIAMASEGAMMILTSSRMGSTHINVAFTDNSGDTLWWRSYGNGVYDNGRSISHASDGNVLISGDCFFVPEDSLYLAKIGINGNILWQVYAGYDEGYIFGGHNDQASDGGFFNAGTKLTAGNYAVGLIKYRSESGVYQYSPSPSEFVQFSCQPNPFRENTCIRLQMAGALITDDLRVELSIYDAVGRLVRSFGVDLDASDPISIYWDGRDPNGVFLPGGVYLAVAQTKSSTSTCRAQFILIIVR